MQHWSLFFIHVVLIHEGKSDDIYFLDPKKKRCWLELVGKILKVIHLHWAFILFWASFGACQDLNLGLDR